MEGPQSPRDVRDGLDSDVEVESSNRCALLKYKTVKVYSAAIAELYYIQVLIGLN
jgi:hypothetical protein